MKARKATQASTAWMDNIKTWTGLSVEESIKTTDVRDKWRKYVHGVAECRTQARRSQARRDTSPPVTSPP